MYVIKKGNGKYVAMAGSKNSYTNRLTNARTFSSREAAEAQMCPGNEYVVDVMHLLRANG